MGERGHADRRASQAWPKPRRSFGLIPRTPAHIKPAPPVDWLAPPPPGTRVVRATTDAMATVVLSTLGVVAVVVFELIVDRLRWDLPALAVGLGVFYMWGWRAQTDRALRSDRIGRWSDAARFVPTWRTVSVAAMTPILLVGMCIGFWFGFGGAPPAPVFAAVLIGQGGQAVAFLRAARAVEQDTGGALYMAARSQYRGPTRVWAQPADTV